MLHATDAEAGSSGARPLLVETGSGFETETGTTGASSTVTVKVPSGMPAVVALIWAVPGATAVTVPSSSTMATDGSLELHVMAIDPLTSPCMVVEPPHGSTPATACATACPVSPSTREEGPSTEPTI